MQNLLLTIGLCWVFPAIIALFIGSVMSLTAILPLLNGTARRYPLVRKGLCAVMCLIAALAVVTWFGDLLVYKFYDSTWPPVDNNTLEFELWLRLMAPRVFEGQCLSGNTVMCRIADEKEPHGPFFLQTFVVPALVAGLTTCLRVWTMTQPAIENAAPAP